ncbi:MAG TPA: hypothetical protein VHM91_22780, partial [Verrucomicrobiales bacterium]|nr:hypothetical protein [Verrucomicrobiales bacterium]
MKLPRLVLCLSLFSLAQSTFAQQPVPPQQLLQQQSARQGPSGSAVGATAAPESPAEVPFILNFPGGTVQEFVKAVELATASPFNLIIPQHAKDLMIPPVNVKE